MHYDSLIGYLQIRCGIHINSVWKFSALFNNSVGKCCLHSFYYNFSIYFHCSASIPYCGQKANWYTRNGSSREHSLPGTKVPGNLRSQERKFPGTFIPGSGGSHGNIRSEERKYWGAKSPDTSKSLGIGNFGVSELRNPWTDRLKIWHTWLCWWVDLVCQMS